MAAAGGHNLLLVGPPASGKSMLAVRLPTIPPPPTPAELLEVSMVASVHPAEAPSYRALAEEMRRAA